MEIEPAFSEPEDPQPAMPPEGGQPSPETPKPPLSSEKTQKLGDLALVEPVERVREAGPGKKPEPIALQGVIAELRRQASNRRRFRRFETA